MTTNAERLAKIYAHEINMQHDIRKSIEAAVEAAFLKGYEVGFRRGSEKEEERNDIHPIRRRRVDRV